MFKPSDTPNSKNEIKSGDTYRNTENTSHGWQHALAGAAAGMTASLITCPFDVVKARMQSQSQSTL